MAADDRFSEILEALVMDHSSRPRGFGELAEANAQAEGINPLAGDRFLIQFQIEANQILQAKFSGSGSALATASASIMTGYVQGQSVDAAKSAIEDVLSWINEGEENSRLENDELAVLLEIQQFPHRRNCASFAWRTALTALQKYE